MEAARPGQEGSVQTSEVSMYPWESTEVAHHGEPPSTVVHRSLCRPPLMKGNTQLPQLPAPVVFDEGDDVETGDGD